MPDFLLQANLRGEPALLAQPVTLVDGSSSCPRVIAATPKAREAGVAIGMTKTQAAQLAGIRHRSIAQEQSTHAALLDCARSSSPRVEDTAQNTVVIDLEGLEHLLGPPSQIASRLLKHAEDLGLIVHLAFALNPDIAVLAARGFPGVTMIAPGKEAQKLGDLPVTVLHPEPEMLAALDRWGVHRLKELAELPTLPLSERLGQEGVRLQKLACGLHFRALVIAREEDRFEEGWELETPATTLDELNFIFSNLLTRLSKRLAIRSLATQEMRLRLDLAQGMEPEPSLALEEQRRETKEQRQEMRDKRQATRPDSSLVSCLSSLKYERTLRFPSPINNAGLFLKLWRLRLESDLPQAPVMMVHMAAQPARPRALQGGLFAPLAPDPEKLELTLARIAAVVGRENVGSPEVADTHRPHAFRMAAFNPAGPKVPFQAVRNRARTCQRIGKSQWNNFQRPGREQADRKLKIPNSKSQIHTSEILNLGFEILDLKYEIKNLQILNPKSEIQNLKSACTMALRLFRPPLLARVELSSGRLLRLFSSLVRGRITFAAGPWAKSGGWWEEEKWNREEWDVEIRNEKASALYSIYYDRARNEWYVDGEYD